MRDPQPVDTPSTRLEMQTALKLLGMSQPCNAEHATAFHSLQNEGAGQGQLCMMHAVAP